MIQSLGTGLFRFSLDKPQFLKFMRLTLRATLFFRALKLIRRQQILELSNSSMNSKYFTHVSICWHWFIINRFIINYLQCWNGTWYLPLYVWFNRFSNSWVQRYNRSSPREIADTSRKGWKCLKINRKIFLTFWKIMNF